MRQPVLRLPIITCRDDNQHRLALHAEIIGLLHRHATDDWGDLDPDDKAANDAAHRLAEGRLFSSYATPEHGLIWVITEDLRSEAGGPTTTVLFPDDY